MKKLIKGTQDTMKIKVILKSEYSTIEKNYNELLTSDLDFIKDKINDGYIMKVEVIQ